MSEQIQEMPENDGLDDAGTLSGGNMAECPYPEANIKIDRVQFSIFELKRRYDKGSICLDPDFQRNDVWKLRQRSELIESVIMGIPLPLIYMAETMEGKLVIVDGRQRLTTFFKYMDNEFFMRDLKILPYLNGCKFSDLEKDEKKKRYAAVIEDFQLVIQIIKYPTPDRIRFDIFDRVNRGGTPLNNQEMRNALYQGKATVLLKNLSESEVFKKATGNAVSPVHMKDRYIILRAISFHLWKKGELKKADGGIVSYRSDIQEFLGYAMEQLNRMEQPQVVSLEASFCEVMKRIYIVLGEDAFRIPTDAKRKRPVNMALFESLYYLFQLLMEDGGHVFEKSEIRDAVGEMFEESIFLDALTYNVDSAVHVETRFRIPEKKYKGMSDVKKNIN